MSRRFLFSATFSLAALAIGAAAVAQDAMSGAINARQGHMQIMQLNLGVLGNMARGNIEYDAEQATLAANNLVTMGQISQAFYWPAGSDNASVEGTRALPALWQNFPDVISISQDYVAATANLAAVAGDGLDAMRAAVGPVGQACGACHDGYRATQ